MNKLCFEGLKKLMCQIYIELWSEYVGLCFYGSKNAFLGWTGTFQHPFVVRFLISLNIIFQNGGIVIHYLF